ncbi:MAG TPA: pyridoxal phosphate-dependent aminotransferase [Hyphomicrobiales bacterium]|nr:pyridoxal phosphate-dependent aminotransferase [Kaistiaceae bacterium]HQF31226.1 pyridoxal phosphate-dependent aminotransferase [Hyphomicrobiales bacterium]
MSQSDLLAALRPEAREAPGSGIVEVMSYGFGRKGLIPLWAGEGDLATPAFIRDAAAASLAAGETFYTYQGGLPELRASLAGYFARLYGKPFVPEQFSVTGSGMQSIKLAIELTAGAGDEVVIPSPAWPNIVAAVGIFGARPVEVPMTLGNDGWKLDLDQLFAACGPKARAIFLNSPCNPTGWTATREELAAILDFCRKRGIWIIADEIYARFSYGRERAPSFHDVAEEDDRILYVNTFSKNWAMTGWRIGWLGAPRALAPTIENLIQYSTSGVAVFMQRAAIAAIDEGEAFIAEQVARAAAGREIVCSALEATGQVRLSRPDGAFYLFFAIDGEPDTRRLGLRLVDEAEIGLAPGTAFGAGGNGYLRLCFARSAESLTTAAGRLVDWLERRAGSGR